MKMSGSIVAKPFTKTFLLTIIIGVVIDDWNTINEGVLVKKNNKCCIDIIKEINNLRQKTRKDET